MAIGTHLKVDLGDRSYPIHFGKRASGLMWAEMEGLLAEGRPVAAVTDGGFSEAQEGYLRKIPKGIPTFVLPAGEASKSIHSLRRVYDFLSDSALDRRGAVFALGGGMVGDLAGFAAATYLRGVAYYQVPTTLLAMVDSSVGGKTGINIDSGKNLVGVFHQPRAVFVDTGLLATLSPREFSSGMAEVIKTGLLGDAELVGRVVTCGRLAPGREELPGVIRRCCEIKASVVAMDEEERATSGGRAILNLGHTFGHAIEATAGYGEYLHGEAVAVGLVLAARLSQEMGFLDGDEVAKIRELLSLYDLPVVLRNPLGISELMSSMQRDKKVRRGAMRFVVLNSVGSATTVGSVGRELLYALWSEVGAAL